MAKKTLRFACAVATALTLVLLMAGAAWAEDPAQLNYADIALRVPKDNLQLDVLQRSLPLLQKTQDDLSQNAPSGGDASKAVSSLTRTYRNMLANLNPMDPNNQVQIDFATFMLQSVSLGAMTADSSTTTLNSINLQIAQTRIQIEQTQAQLINGGQQLFVGYLQLQDNLKKMQDSRGLLENSLNLARVQQSTGLGTALAVKQAELAVAELDTSILQLESQGAVMLDQLKLIVGWPQQQIMKLGSIPKPDRAFFATINLNADIKSAQTNSYSLKSKQQEQKYSSDDDQTNLIKRTIAAMTEQIALTVSTQYQKIDQQNNALLLEEQRLAVAEEKIKQSRLQHQLGLLSDLALQSAEQSYTAQQEAVSTAMVSLFWEIENYKAIVAGLN